MTFKRKLGKNCGEIREVQSKFKRSVNFIKEIMESYHKKTWYKFWILLNNAEKTRKKCEILNVC